MKAKYIIAKIADKTDSTVHRNYSGRGMFGRNCIGISCSQHKMVEVIEEGAIHGLREASWDNLGRGSIVYWSNISEEDEIDDNSENEDSEEYFSENEEIEEDEEQ